MGGLTMPWFLETFLKVFICASCAVTVGMITALLAIITRVAYINVGWWGVSFFWISLGVFVCLAFFAPGKGHPSDEPDNKEGK
jgi:hypothetical protein